MGKARTKRAINIDQLRDALKLESNPAMRFIDTPEPDDDLTALIQERDDFEIEIEVDGMSDGALQSIVNKVADTRDPKYGKPARVTTKEPINIMQIGAAFGDGHAVTVHSNDLTGTGEKIIEVHGKSEAEIRQVLGRVKFDPEFGRDPLIVKAERAARGEATLTPAEKEQLEARRLIGRL